MATDADRLYWTEALGGLFSTQLDATDDAATALVTAAASPQPGPLVLDGSTLYWADGSVSGGAILAAPAAGGTVTTVATNLGAVYGLAVDADRVLWTNEAAVWAVPKTGGALQRISIAEQGAIAIAVSDTHAYWTTYAGIRAIDLGDPSAVATTIVPMSTQYLAIASGQLYWLAFDNMLDMSVTTVPAAGGTPTVLDRRLNAEGAATGGIACDGSRVYWSSGTDVMSVAIDGSDYRDIAAHNQEISSLAISANSVYWAALEHVKLANNEDELTTGIRRTAKP